MKNVLFLVLMAISLNAAAQKRTITGWVCDAQDSTYMANAHLVVKSNDTELAHTETNEKGFFRVEIPQDAVMELFVSYTGYSPYKVKIGKGKTAIEVGRLFMTSLTQNLQQAVVTASAHSPNRAIYFPTEKDVKISYNVLSLLDAMHLPLFKVDKLNDNATINGGPILWKINGVPKRLSDIKSLRYKDILRIEYTEHPSIRYQDQNIAGIVNIILKKRENGGDAQLYAKSAFTTGFIDGGASTSYHNASSEYSVYYEEQYRDYNKWYKDNREHYQFSDAKNPAVEVIGNPSQLGYIDQTINFSYLYHQQQKTMYSVSFTYNRGRQWNHISSQIFEPELPEMERRTDHQYKGHIPQLDLYWSKEFTPRDKMEVNVLGTLFKGKNAYRLVQPSSTTSFQADNKVDNQRLSAIGEISYTHYFTKYILNTGWQTLFSHTDNTYSTPLPVKDKMNEYNSYLFVSLGGQWGKSRYSLGTGLKIYTIDNTVQRKNNYLNRSTLSWMFYPNPKINLQYNFTYDNTIPSLSQLSDVTQTRDNRSMVKGNPFLKLSNNIRHSLSLNYNSGKFSNYWEAYHNYTYHPIFTAIYEASGQHQMVFEPVNGKSHQIFGLMWQGKLNRLFDAIDLDATIGYDHYRSQYSSLEKYHKNNIHWNVNLVSYYKNWIFSASYGKPQKSLYGNLISVEENLSAATLVYKKNNWSVWAAGYFLFQKDGATYASHYIGKNYQSDQHIRILNNKNMFTLGFSWDFNYGKSSTAPQRYLYNKDNRNSMVKITE